MPIFNVACRYESSRGKKPDFVQTVEAPDSDHAVEVAIDKARTAEHFVIVSVTQAGKGSRDV